MGQDPTAASLTGMNGWTLIDDALTAHVPPTGVISFQALQAVNGAPAVINIATIAPNGIDFDVAITIPLGTTIYGLFKSVTLTSGAVLAYNR